MKPLVNRIDTPFLKVLRDITSDLPKNIILALSIFIGVLGIGAILGAYSVLSREMSKNYMGTNPAMATIKIKNDTISKGLINELISLQYISDVERRATVLGRVRVNDMWLPVLFFTADDFTTMKINKVRHEKGEIEPPYMSMLVERTALNVIHARLGDNITIKTPSGNVNKLKISGIVHDAGLAPAWQEQECFSYITMPTLKAIGKFNGFDEARIIFKGNNLSASEIEDKAKSAARFLSEKGYKIQEISIPPPGKHPHQGQMTGVMTMLIIFSFAVLFLGSALVTTSISTLMLRQIRQIGVMKTIGASSYQIVKLYIVLVFILTISAVLIGIPAGLFPARLIISQISKLLNLEIFNTSIPYWVYLVQLLSGIIVPLLAAIIPIINGSRRSVKNALDNYGVSANNKGIKQVMTFLLKFKLGSDLFILSFRNIFRQRTRLILTLILLSAGGAMFMTSLNISGAWSENIKSIMTKRLDDLELSLEKPVAVKAISDSLYSVKNVRLLETWKYSPTSYIKDVPYDIVRTYPDKGHGSFLIMAPQPSSRLIKYPVLKGRWFAEDTCRELVFNQNAIAQLPFVNIGDSVTLSVFGKPCRWKVTGFIQDIASPAACAYVSQKSFDKVSDMYGLTNLIRISVNNRDIASVKPVSEKIDDLLLNMNLPVNMSVPMTLRGNAYAEHIGVLVSVLLSTAILMAIIGIFSLMSTISMNVFDRTRELGVMKSIGATRLTINKMILYESLIMGITSIIGAILLSLILSSIIGNFIGQMSFRTQLPLFISAKGFIIWFLIIMLGSFVATYFPVRRANRITIREALVYE